MNIRNLFLRIAALLMTAAIPMVVSQAKDAETAISAEQSEFFEAKIRPILVQHCYECHSAESGNDVEGGLLLDSRWGWSTGGDSGPAIVPGDAKESLVMHAVRYTEDVVSAMPPSSKLPADDIKLLEKWISDGAPDPREKVESGEAIESFDLQNRFDLHWSWRDIQRPAPPQVKNAAWSKNFVDRFVLHKLEAAGITPAEPADKAIWLRRVYFDLIGLPPTVQQIDAFLADSSDRARQNVVNELLDSRHFGEKWARHWMDLVRYAETYGHEFDYKIPEPTEYRDYVIRALNADVPYDQFIREHIAGDLIDQPRRHPDEQYNESIIGTGFWYLHEATHSPTDVLKNESDIIDNQLDVFGKAFLGLTIACARCHDHKFDAISTADYYALSGYLQSSCRQFHPLDPKQKISQSVDKLTALQKEYVGVLRNDLAFTSTSKGPAAYFQAASELLAKQKDAEQKDAEQNEAGKTGVTEAAKAGDLNAKLLNRWVDGLRDAKPSLESQSLLDVLAWTLRSGGADKAAVKLLAEIAKQRRDYDGTLFADFGGSELPAGWSSSGHAFEMVSDHSRFVPVRGLPRPVTGTIDSGVFGKSVTGTLRSPTFKISAKNIHVRMRSTAKASVRLIIDNYQMASYNALLFRGVEINKDAADTKGQWAWKSLGNDLRKYVGHNAYLEFVDPGNETIAVDEIWFSDQKPPRADAYFASALRRGLSDSTAWWNSIGDAYRDGKLDQAAGWLLDHNLIDQEVISADAKAIVARANKIASSIPAPRFVLAMAQGTKENANVYVRGNSAMLGQELPPRNLEALGGRELGRLQLANEIASLKNPLTARVMVNRIWHHLFARGIVPTTDDFGPQGKPASHPELLDALAVDFADNGWSIKQAIRNIVLSQAYSQSSIVNSSNSSELIENTDPTNSLLYRMPVRRLPAEAIRDQILAVSGRLNAEPIAGSVPTYRTPFMTGRGARDSGPIDGDGRRSIYLAVYRNFLNSFMLTFDMPNPFGPRGRRSVSNVPAQSLTLLNDPFVLEQADWWAKLLLTKDQSQQERIVEMVRAAHGVPPSSAQVDRLTQFVEQHPDAGKNEQQVWADLAHALFNVKAFCFLR